MTDAELSRYATLICDAIQDGTRFARANSALARERARQPVKQLRGGLESTTPHWHPDRWITPGSWATR